MLDERAGAPDAVTLNHVGVDARNRPVNQCVRNAVALQQSEAGARLIRNWYDQQTINPALEHVGNVFALVRKTALRIAQHDVVTGAPSDALRTPRNRRIERIADVGHDEPEDHGLARAQTSRQPIRDEAERSDDLLHRHACFGSNATVAVDDTRDRHRRHASAPGDLAHGGSSHAAAGPESWYA